MLTLPVSRLIQVGVSLSPTPAVGRNFGDMLEIGDSKVISGLERIRQYASLPEVAADFGTTAPEYLGAKDYFAQKPTPQNLSIGRWLRTASSAQLDGAILTAAQSALGLFTAITSGGFDINIDGTAHNITGLNFSAQTNLNGVAALVQTALSGFATVIWNGFQFVVTSLTSGAGVEAFGTITLGSNPSPGDTVTINGLSIQFVASAPTGNQVLIGGTNLLTATNLNTFLVNSTSPNLLSQTYSVSGDVVTVTYDQVGTVGDAITLAKSSTAITLSGSTLSGGQNPSLVSYMTPPGSGQDISTLFGMTSALALPLVPGYAAESALEAVVALDAISTAWYFLEFASSVMPTDTDNLEIAPFIEADPVTRMFGITIQNTNVLSALVTNDLASQLMALGYEQTLTQYCSTDPYAVGSIFGRLSTVDFTQQNSVINVMWKVEPGIAPEALTSNQADVLQNKRVNVYVAYDNGTSILQYGTMAGPAFIDQIYGVDWYQNAVQTAVFNVPYTQPSVPQTDPGENQLVSAINQVNGQAIFNGFGAPGQWNAPGFGQLQEGQYLKLGYYTFAQPVSSQSESDRAARKAVPIQSALKLAGNVNTAAILLSVNP
jgi:hypothetical protein